MSSLKRILNQDDPDGPLRDFRGASPQGSPLSDFPTMNDHILSGVWSNIPGDNNLQDDCLDPGDTLLNDNFFSQVEQDLDSWAALTLPSAPDLDEPTNIDAHHLIDAQVCYGMILRVAMRLHGDMTEILPRLRNKASRVISESHTFNLQRSTDERIFITFLDGQRLALLNEQTSKILENVISLQQVDFEVVIPTTVLLDAIDRAHNTTTAVFRSNIHVYGPLSSGSKVGDHLMENKLFLQRPDKLRQEHTYENPQELKFPGFHIAPIEIQLETKQNSTKANKVTVDQLEKAVTKVYNTLKRDTKLSHLKGDQKLRTKLLPHQQKGLDFMVQRETGQIQSEFRLWEPIEMDGSTWYRHSITNMKSREQHEERGGGILADEMGMGKSLSILALIVRTMQSGLEWAEAQQSLEEQHSRKTHSRSTLVVVASALLINNWMNEIDIHLHRSIRVLKHHGRERVVESSVIADSDIVITTYNTLAVEYSKGRSPLHGINWYRVVLDEGHIIRRQGTAFYRTAYALSAHSRWCLTGTPIQNRLEDIGTLFAFIRARPFDSLANFRRYVATPFAGSEEQRDTAVQRLTLLIDSLCLRRTKNLLALHNCHDRVRELEFTTAEFAQYEQTKNIMKRALRQQSGEYDRKSMFGMFQAWLQLRILCNHGTYQHHFTWAKSRNILDEQEAVYNIDQNREFSCSSCRQMMPIMGSNAIRRKYVENCAHVLCSECLFHADGERADIENGLKEDVLHCPLCVRAPYSTTSRGDGINMLDAEYFRPQGFSTKISALVEDVKQDLPRTKSIIFSCWTRTLNLIAKHLREERIPFERIDGDCLLPRRQKILDEFAKDSMVRILIMTTGTGAFGLNLTSANRVFIVEPQWNPSVENQAIARAIRLGQTQEVSVTRYVIRGTVEMEMKSQQERKLRLAQIGL